MLQSSITPQQLEAEITKIKTYLPADLQLPVEQGNLLPLHRIMTVRGVLTKGYAIFTIKLPLVNQEHFDLFNVIPVPVVINNTMFSLNNLTPLVPISLHWDQYFLMNTEKLNSCMQIEEGDFLCSGIQAIYNKGFGLQSCEVSLLSNESHPDCKFTELKTDAMWLQMKHKNDWIFTVKTLVRMTAVCGTEIYI